jgi:hypothetical protein
MSLKDKLLKARVSLAKRLFPGDPVEKRARNQFLRELYMNDGRRPTASALARDIAIIDGGGTAEDSGEERGDD